MNEKVDKALKLLPVINYYYFEGEVPSMMELVDGGCESVGNTDYYLSGDFGLSIYEDDSCFFMV